MHIQPDSRMTTGFAQPAADEKPLRRSDGQPARADQQLTAGPRTVARQARAQRAEAALGASVRMSSAQTPPSRAERGSTQGKPKDASPFRERGGGEALRRLAQAYYPFDQADYSARVADGRRGSCEGWVREAARFLDRDTTVFPSLLQAIYRMDNAANTRASGIAHDLFSRVGAFQQSATSLGFRRYSADGAAVMYQSPLQGPTPAHGAATARVLTVHKMLNDLITRLRAGDIAHIRLDAGPVAGETQRAGHALLLERMLDNRYAVFDPNNGVFIFGNPLSIYDGLRQYIDDAFGTEGRQLAPDQVRFYRLSDASTSGSAAGLRQWVPTDDNCAEPMTMPTVAPPVSATRDAYQAPSEMSNRLSRDTLAAAAMTPHAPIAGDGLPMYVMTEIAHGSSPDLSAATERTWRQFTEPTDEIVAGLDIERFERENPYGLVGDMDGYVRRDGARDLTSADGLVSDLERAFSQPHRGDLAERSYRTDFAIVSLGLRNAAAGGGTAAAPAADAHPVIVQRLYTTADFRRDRYDIYDPDVGVFRYGNFAEMVSAWRGIFSLGYQERGGVSHASTSYYLNTANPSNSPPASLQGAAARPTPASRVELGSVEQLLGNTEGLLHFEAPTAPPPLPLFAQRGSAPRDEIRRAIDGSEQRQPPHLFRPSTLAPADLKSSEGFNCERTKLANVNLQLHDADVAAHPHLLDSAGYLGMFRNEESALKRLPGVAPERDRYLYLIAPTPNMVDVNGTLGSYAKTPHGDEVAAMGRVLYAQIRGWKVVRNGVPGPFTPNPDYQWEVFDRTSTSGAQPQLARFPIDSDAWLATPFAPYVSNPVGAAGTRSLTTNADHAHALFYDHAWQKVRDIAKRQRAALDYRGAMRMQAYGAADRTHTEVYLDGQNNVYVNTMYAWSSKKPDNKHLFVMADTGRLHVARGPGKVMRVDGSGYVYAGPVPDDNASLNGVFDYVGGHLVHQEDGKYLTTGLSSYTPFVDYDRGARSQWSFKKADGTDVTPARVNTHTFRDSTAGSPQQLYAFYEDPDSALPRSATHFVTAVPGRPPGELFLDYRRTFTPSEMSSIGNWLRANNAAWLFKDGFYAISEGAGRLDVYTLGGAPAFRAERLAPHPGEARFANVVTGSNYRIRHETWDLVTQYEKRRSESLAKLQRGAPNT